MNISLSKYIRRRKEKKVYYNIVESGIRVKELRTVRNMTRQQLAEKIGISVDALRKIETGANGAKIDTLVNIADFFNISLDYLVCGSDRKVELDGFVVGLNVKEIQFIRNMVRNTVTNLVLLKK